METLLNIPYFLVFILQLSSLVYPLSLLIAHNADMFSKFEEFPGGVVSEHIGGFARTRYALNECRRQATTRGTICLYLYAGGTLTGSLWHTVYGWEVTARFMKMLKPDVMALGVHDFDISVQNLSAYIRAVGAPVVCANADFSDEPSLAKVVKPYHVMTVDGLQVGIVGYITPNVTQFGMTGNVKFKKEHKAIRRACQQMKKRGIKMIIALGYAGFSRDLHLAKKLKDVTIVIGGMTNTLLWTGPKSGKENPYESYPMVVKREGEEDALLLHAGAYTKYLGKIDLRFTRKGKIVKYNTEVVYLSSTFPQDKEVADLLELYKPKVDEYKKTVVGRSWVFLFGSFCAVMECNFGNLVTDALVDYVADLNSTTHSSYWSRCSIGLYNGGDIEANVHGGIITVGALEHALPLNQYISLYTVKGSQILRHLEQGIRSELLPQIASFPQVSGLFVQINSNAKVGDRISAVKVRCTRCIFPYFVNMMNKKWYRVVAPDNLLGDDSIFRTPVLKQVKLGVSVLEVLHRYIGKKKRIRPEQDNRFRYVTTP